MKVKYSGTYIDLILITCSLLGHNGAGKTTTLNILTGLI